MNWITIKVIAERQKQYVAWVQFLLILYIFIDQSPYSFWLVVPLSGIVILVLGFLDYKLILPKEYEKNMILNPFMVKIKKDLADIKEMLKGKR